MGREEAVSDGAILRRLQGSLAVSMSDDATSVIMQAIGEAFAKAAEMMDKMADEVWANRMPEVSDENKRHVCAGIRMAADQMRLAARDHLSGDAP